MPKLYDSENHELFHLTKLWMDGVNLDDEVYAAMSIIAEKDYANVESWAYLYTQVKLVLETFGNQHPQPSSANASIILRRSTILEDAERYFNSQSIPKYLLLQAYNFMSTGFEFANQPDKAMYYKELLTAELDTFSDLDKLILKIEITNAGISQTRLNKSKPRDNLTEEVIEKYNFLKDSLNDYFFELNTIKMNTYLNADKLSLAYCKLGQGFRKVDSLDHAITCAQTAYELDKESNVLLNNLAILLQKKATHESLLMSVDYLQFQLEKDITSNKKRFVTPYYLAYSLCQLAHLNLINKEPQRAHLNLLQASHAQRFASAAIETYQDSNYAIKAQWRLGLIRSYQNVLITALNHTLPTLSLELLENDLNILPRIDSANISTERQATFNAKLAFFQGLDSDKLPEQVVDFTNSSFYL